MTLTNSEFSLQSGKAKRFDVLARASRQAVVRTVRATTLKGNPSMAKTLRSRIAAVAVAALGAGVLVAAPANADPSPTETGTPFRVTNAYATDATDPVEITAKQIAGANNYISVGFDGSTYKYPDTFTSGVRSGFLTVSGGTFSSLGALNTTVDAAGTTAVLGTNTATTNVNVLTPSTGTITVKFIVRTWSSGVATDATKQTITVSVIAAAPASVYDHSKLGGLGHLGTDTYADADDRVFAPKGTAGSAVKAADFTVTQWANAGETTKVDSSYTKAITASISGPGLLKLNNAGASTTYLAVNAGTTGSPISNDQVIGIYNDGRSGVATVTITVNGVVVGTKSVTFYGAATQYSVSVTNANVKVGGTGTIKVTAKDANGVVVPTAMIYAKSSDTTKATITGLAGTAVSVLAASLGTATFTATGVAAGNVTFTFSDDTTDASVTATGAVLVSAGSPTTVTISFDKATYVPGEKATVTVTAVDSNGYLQGDDAYANLFTGTGVTSSVALGGSLPGASVTLAKGVATYTVYMPLAAGPVSVSGKTGTSLVTASQGLTVSATANVVADTAALDAVKAQVAALTTTVTGIQTAIATLVASITATLTVIQSSINKIIKKLKVK